MNTLARRGGRPTEVDVSVDVTRVMNMFIILIPFLVSMAAFSHLAVQQLALPGNAAAGIGQTEEEAPLIISLSADGILAMRGNQTLGQVDRFGGVDGSLRVSEGELVTLLWPLLEDARVRFPKLDRVTLAVADEIVCGEIVACFDACRQAGFADIGIAESAR